MECIETKLAEVLLFRPHVYGDERGYFMETFRQSYIDAIFTERGMTAPVFVQHNHSRSQQHVLRGLHFQQHKPQGKLVRVCAGAIFDVAVDIRTDSPTYGQWVGYELSAENHLQMWIPPGFAHGFYVQSDSAEVIYQCSAYYSPEDERVLAWDHPDFAIDWPLSAKPILSERDRAASFRGAIFREALG